MASTSLTRTFGQTGNRTIMTFSAWVKKMGLGTNQMLFTSSYQGNSAYQSLIFFDSSDRLVFKNVDTSSTTMHYVSTRVFRDTSAWYHVVWAFDTTQSTAANRVKLYVNGEQITSFSTETIPSQNADNTWYNITQTHKIGVKAHSNSDYFNGVMSHVHFIDGTAYTPSTFGSVDSATGEWKINTSPSVTYGSQGFFILKDGNSVTDQSGNSNNLTVGGGTLTKTEDCPSNVFATFNRLSGAHTMAVNSTFANGNNKVTCGGTVYAPFGSTIGVNSGKYYAEFKIKSAAADGMIGIFAKNGTSNSHYLGNLAYQYCWYNDSGRIIGNNANIQTGVGQYTTNDIIGIALDCTNNKLYFHKNGTYITNGSGTGNPSSGTYGYSITDPASTDLGFYFMAAMDWGGSTRAIWEANFGNGYFGTTAVSSAGTNASNNGIFEYDVPTGYTALSTKGLNL